MEVVSVNTKNGKSIAWNAEDPQFVAINCVKIVAWNVAGRPSVSTVNTGHRVRNATTAPAPLRGVPCMARNFQMLAVSSDICAASMLEIAKP